MCISTSELSSYLPSDLIFRRQQQSKRPNFRVQSLHRRRLSKQAKEKARMRMLNSEMEMKNLKLYMENKSIIEENKKLRKKAALLHQENRALHSQLQNVPHPNSTQNKSSLAFFLSPPNFY